MASIPSYLNQLVAWINNKSTYLYGMWNSSTPGLHPGGQVTPGEGGVDLASPGGTPVYALASGPIVGAGYWNDIGHGVITTRVNVPGYGTQDLYYQHIILDPSITQCQGGSCTQTVQKGQLLGTIGQYNEIEMGFNAAWGGIWGTNHPAPWAVDPRNMLAALVNNFGSTSTSTGSGSGAGSISGAPSSGGSTTYPSTCPPFDIACGMASLFSSNQVRQVGLLFVGLILLLIGLQVLFFGKKEES